MFGICNNLGLLPDLFFPTGTGREYAASPYLKLLEAHRNDFTVFSGVSHPNVDGGHPSDISFLTAAPHPASSSFRNTISLDQYIAERIGTLTRFPSLTLAVNGAARSLSWTGTGVAIPPEERASEVFNQLFLQGTPEQVEAQIRKLDTGRSILDAVADQAKELAAQSRRARPQPSRSIFHQRPRPRAPPAGVARLGEQTEAGRERMPRRSIPPSPAQYMDKVKAMYDLARLAFETDSTRAITLMLNSVGTPVVTFPARPSPTATTTSHTTENRRKNSPSSRCSTNGT